MISLWDPDFNTLKIEGLKKTVDFACTEIREVKGKVTHIDDRVNVAEKKVSLLEQRMTELENYSQRWNLWLYDMAENKDRQSILPEHKAKLTWCWLSAPSRPTKERCHQASRDNSTVWCPYRDAVWKAAKKSTLLQNNKLRFPEDLSPAVRERRMQLWPLVAKAREQEKAAYFVGGRVFANGAELSRHVQPWQYHFRISGPAISD